MECERDSFFESSVPPKAATQITRELAWPCRRSTDRLDVSIGERVGTVAVTVGNENEACPSSVVLAQACGDWLKSEIVEPAGVSVTDLAGHFGVSRRH